MTGNQQQLPPPGWYDDGSGYFRWWDGFAWGDYARTDVAASEPGYQAQQVEYGYSPEVSERPADRFGPVLALVGAGAGLLGSVTPWVKAGPLSASGLDGDGVVTLALMVATILAATLALVRQSGWSWGIVLAGLPAVAVAAYNLIDINSSIGELQTLGADSATIGWGLWLTAIGSTMAVTGGAIALIASRRPPY